MRYKETGENFSLVLILNIYFTLQPSANLNGFNSIPLDSRAVATVQFKVRTVQHNSCTVPLYNFSGVISRTERMKGGPVHEGACTGQSEYKGCMHPSPGADGFNLIPGRTSSM